MKTRYFECSSVEGRLIENRHSVGSAFCVPTVISTEQNT